MDSLQVASRWCLVGWTDLAGLIASNTKIKICLIPVSIEERPLECPQEQYLLIILIMYNSSAAMWHLCSRYSGRLSEYRCHVLQVWSAYIPSWRVRMPSCYYRGVKECTLAWPFINRLGFLIKINQNGIRTLVYYMSLRFLTQFLMHGNIQSPQSSFATWC